MATVLLVEDDADNLMLVCTVIARAGHHTVTAADRPGALDAARTHGPELILLDASLTGPITGLDVCRSVRADPTLAHIPVIMMSGWAADSDIAAGRAAGADNYLAKPFTPAELETLASATLAGLQNPVPSRTTNSTREPGRGRGNRRTERGDKVSISLNG